MKIEHILVTTDLSPEALRACAPAAELARMAGARITLLHVVESAGGTPHGAPFAPEIAAPDAEDRLRDVRPHLQEQAAAFANDVTVSLDAVVSGDVAGEIAEYAKRNGVGLIALSTHGRTGFRHLALGSVAEAVVRRSSVPVLVFPRPKD